MMSEEFGQYLRSVEERDLDLLLLEELHASAKFAAWFIDLFDLGEATSFDGAWHSISEHDGETDLLLRVKRGNERVLILVENKINAPEQQTQDLRYHLRGDRAREAGHCELYVTAMCAPQVYLDGLADDSAYEHRISYEKIATWFAALDDSRAAWRKSVLDLAITHARRGYLMKVHSGKTAFHRDYFDHVRAKYPELIMRRPDPKGGKSDWIYLKGFAFPKGVTLIHKNDQGCVDLQFEKTAAVDLATRKHDGWPQGAAVVPRGGSAAVSLPVPRCDMERSLLDQVASVDAALEAARALVQCIKPYEYISTGKLGGL
jgi:hypothetical protein